MVHHSPNKKNILHPVIAAIMVVAFVIMAGCGPKMPETAGVRGRITYGGKPVAPDRANNIECEICFWPEDGQRPARGEIDSNGNYCLNSFAKGDGAMPGKYNVTIKAVKVHLPEGGPDAGVGRLEWLVPQIYEHQSTSGLTATVEPGENEINFDLKRE